MQAACCGGRRGNEHATDTGGMGEQGSGEAMTAKKRRRSERDKARPEALRAKRRLVEGEQGSSDTRVGCPRENRA